MRTDWRGRESARRGAAIVELAICLPVLMLLVLGAIESCNGIFLRQALAASAYEGARAAILREGTNADLNRRIQTVLNARRITVYTVTTTPTDVSAAARGDDVTVNVTANYGTSVFLPSSWLRGKNLSAAATMVKE